MRTSTGIPPSRPPAMSVSSGGSGVDGGSSSLGSADFSTNAEQRPMPPHSSVPAAASQLLCTPIRTMVSQNRRRYQTDGFNLDLTYITDRIIAMGYPADTTEALYRNSMDSIVQFLEYNHSGHYKVFNLRGQYVYDTSKFHNRVLSFEMVDHHPPRLEMMAPFCREVHEYLAADASNVVAVHCKAGKGRTGVMICAYLVYISFYPSPRQNMDYYSIVRTHNNKGVTIPSQRRYVYYFSHLRQKKLNYLPLRVELVGVWMERPPKLKNSFFRRALRLRVVNGDVDVFFGDGIVISKEDWEEEEAAWAAGVVSKGEGSWEGGTGDCISRRAFGWTVPSGRRVFLEGDVRIELHSCPANPSVPGIKQLESKIGHCWLNSMFLCPSYCGGAYEHGDEAYPYPPGETTIFRRRHANGMRGKSGSASVPSSPPLTPKPMQEDRSGGSLSGRRAPSFDARKSNRSTRFSQLNNPFKKNGVSSRTASDLGMRRKEEDKGRLRGRRQMEDKTDSDDELIVIQPPGLNNHCDDRSLKLIYSRLKKEPPRVAIETMLRDAHEKNLMSDVYNERRLSVPQEGSPVISAPIGRCTAGGPNCIMRKPDEHVTIFSVLEMDGACKNKEMDPAFKMYVVTRCVPPNDERLAEKFLEVTREKQKKKDDKKKQRVERRQHKLMSGNSSSILPVDQLADSACAMEGEGIESDPRLSDPHMRRYFYRQRTQSISRYPPGQYRCPLLASSSCTEKPQPQLASTCPSGDDAGTSVQWDTRCSAESMSDLDFEVRSYHPDDSNRWGQTCSSASSTSVSSEADATVSTPPPLPTIPFPPQPPSSSSPLPSPSLQS